MSYECQLIDRPVQPVASIRTRAAVENLPQVLGQAYGAIAQYLGQIGQFPAGEPFAAYYNMDMQDLDLEIGFPVSAKIPGKETIQPGEIPGGKAVVCMHVGPYDKIAAAYEAMDAWMKTNHIEPTGICYEFYLKDPQTTPPEALETRIVFPVKS
ncbi:MAG: GyrI-like domain-containing protein [Anaerolineales bacterium]|nr:GyrI-like domain-containing protein [Anaerolineales bacterium]